MVSPRPYATAAGGIGLFLVLLASTVMGGWLLHWPWAVTLGNPELVVVFSTALALALLGAGVAALSTGSLAPALADRAGWATTACGGAAAVLCALRVVEAATGWPVALDIPDVHRWLDRQWLTGWVGAPQPSHALALGITGLALALAPGLSQRRQAILFYGLLAMSVLISGIDLLGKAMDLEYLYPAWQKWRASNVAAVCNLLAVAAIGCVVRVRHRRLWQTRLSPEDTIVWISGGCVLLAGLGATVTAFILQIENASTTFSITRAQALTSYAEEFDQAFTARIESARLIAATLRVQDVLRHPADNTARLSGLTALSAYRELGYSYLALRTPAGETVLKLGTEIDHPELAVPLHGGLASERATLQWAHGFSMRTETPVMADGTQVGWLVAEQPLARMTARYTGTRGMGITETLAMAGRDARGRLMSFPQRFDAYVFELPTWMPEHRPLPSRLAVAGQTGYGQWRDIHGTPTAFSYTPIGHTGLALISKIASAELYAPMRQQFERLGGFMLCMMMGSVLAIRVTVQPFANRLAASERALRTANEHLERRRDALRASREQLRLVADNVPAQLSYIDSDNVLRFASRTLQEAFGRTEAEMLDRPVRELYAPDDYRTLLPYMIEVLAGYPVQFEITSTSMQTGTPRYLSGHYYPDYDDRGSLRGYFSVLQDLTLRKTAELALVRSERALKLVLDNAPLLVSHINAHGVFTFCNVTHARWLQRRPEEVYGRHTREVFTPGTYALLAPYIERALAGESVEFEINVPWYEKATGSSARSRTRYFRGQFVVDVTDAGERDGFYAFVQDVTEAKRSEMELSHMAHFDALTGLANRYELYERLRTALERRQRQPAPMGVLYLDVDHFKRINDTYGHAAGDAVLVEVARRLQHAVRRTDTVARLAGDEFVILLDPIDAPDDALHTAQKVVAAIRPPVQLRGDIALNVTASIGVACPGPEAADADAVLREADRALYWAKSRGRNTAA
ncbi:sensor domain-containing diguanylate cyclase [Ralstonia solanacearum]|uniref:sensor domain-containing diguanylate cyclase n=1 Tax=Ralstonia solanacearum TaxID=305 RepID=UPI00078C284A|nr:sensor domain-containing diguanylate cyclase [Ralstonia solanacearum]AMP38679.1 diguanylate cyclase [Ralstonia solanacearum]AXV87505.1 sensor domain-containing diguanylate cyclase [Ralstonia solanacearum]AXW06987.1 sensor domain-containing diguanylate cyclase [Ralstonia solanacearum]AXW24749.1 sensor domain-containing diguanylate cyclase [Ralstonia solanacearum]AXW81666.1 sensor domain-containing diguanylate cyclase [Ralstonia solanacearum]